MTAIEIHPETDGSLRFCPVVGCDFSGDRHEITDHLDDEHGLSDKILSGEVVIRE